MKETMQPSHLPRVGEQYYYPRGAARVEEINRGSYSEFDAVVLVAPRTVVEVTNVTDRNVQFRSDGKRVKGPVHGHLADQVRLSHQDAQLASHARRLITREEITSKDSLPYQAWRKVQEQRQAPSPVAYVPVEVVIGDVIPGEVRSTLPNEATIVSFSTDMRSNAAD